MFKKIIQHNDEKSTLKKGMMKMLSQPELLKYLRTNKNVTQFKLCKDICPRSTYATFEKVGYSISSDILLQLLDRLNIKLDEFQPLLQGKSSKKELAFFELVKAIETKNKSKLLRLEKNFLDNYKEAEDIWWLLYVFKAQEAYERLNLSFTKENFKKQHEETFLILYDYLVSTPQWYKFEYTLFGNLLIYLQVDEIKPLIEKIHSRLDLKNESSQELYLKIAVNSILTLFELHAYEEAKELVYHALPYAHKVERLHFKIILLFFKELYQELLKKQATPPTYEFLKIYRAAGFEAYYQALLSYRTKILEN